MEPHVARALVKETRAVFEKADQAFAPYSCPATAECCQLTKTGRPPWLYASEWEAVRAELAVQKRALPPPREDGGCPFLDAAGKRCTIYASRPLGCRTYFCHRIKGPPNAPVDAMNALLERLHKLHLTLDGKEVPRPLGEWYEAERGSAPSGSSADRGGP
jgi:Fe-S-cluster containining protein